MSLRRFNAAGASYAGKQKAIEMLKKYSKHRRIIFSKAAYAYIQLGPSFQGINAYRKMKRCCARHPEAGWREVAAEATHGRGRKT